MSTQTYANHGHRPVYTLVATAFWVVAVIGLVGMRRGEAWGDEAAALGLLGAIFCLISISRLYITRLQDRIIVLEEQIRAERLLSPASLAQWRGLGVKQIVALRFASDEELAALTARAAGESLKPDAIKRAVQHWRADHRRT
ncbi:hypothetical protein TBR22_A41260 [Luteitalea sp. TBR-22]|uniref:DUF6526 family protein n=1 Tax=Luteitalea sp. TBR-22 TaxID=2802971 RepID=UPI001AF5A0AF|nr:DUF6526 family protein [Luteitalea sp. TBR-22]BCS34900.1 hypothetical protein TBR22_A41260 [Luteitalea sp. TBR-22]